MLLANLQKVPTLLPNDARPAEQVRACLARLCALQRYAVEREGCRQRHLLGYLGEVVPPT